MPTRTDYDVVIIGGSFSGASTGILLKRALPECRVLIVERAEAFDRKVGESTSEVAGCFLTKVLGLHGYLSRNHVVKHGLRMWFSDDGKSSMGSCSEIGAKFQVRLPTFQLDRSDLDEHLLVLAKEVGCEVVRPAKVKSVKLGGVGKNEVEIDGGRDAPRKLRVGWVIDASGKAAYLARQRGTWRKLEEHPVNSIWARFRGAGDFDSFSIREKFPCYGEMAPPVSRGAATNHLMGYGWWCWIIPLRGGETSVGLTWDTRLFTPPVGGTIPERLKKHLMEHPVGREIFADAVPLEKDARAYSHLSYFSDEVAGDGWAVVGDAVGFMDPLYSQGLDYCAHSVYTVQKLVVESLGGTDVTGRVTSYNEGFRLSYARWFKALYREKYRYLGDAELMYAAFLLDIGAYFVGPVRLVYGDTDKEFSILPYNGFAGAAFAKFMSFYNRRLAKIAEKRRAAGVYGKRNTGASFLVGKGFTPGFGSFLLMLRGMLVWWKCEVKALFLRSATKRVRAVSDGDAAVSES